MADKKILASNGALVDAFVFEGEDLAIEYGDGTTYKIPPHKVHALLIQSKLPSGDTCWIVPEKSPITRLPIVVIEKENTNG